MAPGPGGQHLISSSDPDLLCMTFSKLICLLYSLFHTTSLFSKYPSLLGQAGGLLVFAHHPAQGGVLHVWDLDNCAAAKG